MSAQTIYSKLIEAGATHAGACAIMGNLKWESALRSNNVEDRSTSAGWTDDSYVAAVDNGTYDNFVGDGYGMGLAQWTHKSRKAKLLAYAQSKGVSIADETMQVEFLIMELKESFSALWNSLCSSNEIIALCENFCWNFENPARSTANLMTRQSYAGEFADALEYTGEINGNCESCQIHDDLTDDEATAIASEPNACVGALVTVQIPSCSRGCTGAAVYALQALLKRAGYDPTWVDGDFGQRTHNMLCAYQAEHGLVGDGICGRETWEAILME